MTFPVVHLLRLAVDKRYQNKKIGRRLLAYFLSRAVAVAAETGIYAVVLEPLNDQVRCFYERFGLKSLPNDPGRMVVSMRDVRSWSQARTPDQLNITQRYRCTSSCGQCRTDHFLIGRKWSVRLYWLTIDRPARVGDFIKLESGQEGYVKTNRMATYAGAGFRKQRGCDSQHQVKPDRDHQLFASAAGYVTVGRMQCQLR